MNLKAIAESYLKAKGHDGLCNSLIGCGCEISDLMPCDEPSQNCETGSKQKCDPETCEYGGDCEWHIVPNKEATP